MSSQLLIPPLSELPAGRLVARSGHLRAEIAVRRRDRSRRLVAIVAFAVVLGILLATPAFGLRDHVFHFFTGERHPPEVVVKAFENLTVGPGPGQIRHVEAGRARNVMTLSFPGYGKWPVWVAPISGGGFCTSRGLCDLHHSKPLDAMLIVGGPGKTQPVPRSGRETVIFDGFTDLRGARVSMRFEDGSSERIPLVWVTAPVRAGFFAYRLPKSHWKLGARPVALVAESPSGAVLARNPKVAGYLRFAQRGGLATPAEAGGSSRRVWVFVGAAAILLALAAALVWRRRGPAVALPLLVAAGITAAFAGVGLARGGGYQPPARPEPKPYHLPPTYHAYATGYVREGFLGSHQARDRFLIARTPAEGLRWDRWISHHQVSPPQSADFTRQALVGVFLLGQSLAQVRSVAVARMQLRGGTLRLTLVVSPRPTHTCGPSPDTCRQYYKPHARYHAFTIVAVPRATAARVRRIVVAHERPGRIAIHIGVSHID
jgi:hypothetical protein